MKKLLSIFLTIAFLFGTCPVSGIEQTVKWHVIDDFSKGLNSHINSYHTPANQGVIANNVRVNNKFMAIGNREPLITIIDMGATAINSLHRYYTPSGTGYTVCTTSTLVRADINDVATTIALGMTDGKRWNFLTYKGNMIGTNGYDQPIKWDGETDTTANTDGARTASDLCAQLGAPFAELNTGANLDAASWYCYRMQFLVSGVGYYSTAISNPILTGAAVRDITLTDIPIGPTGTTARYVYRTLGNSSRANAVADSTYYLVSTIADNSTLTVNDAMPDTTADDATAWSTTDKFNALPPKGKFIEVANNHIFIAGNTTYPSNLYFSDEYNPEFFEPDDYERIRYDDGDSITFIKTLHGVLVVGKTNSIQKYFTEGVSDDWYPTDPYSALGCPAPYTAQVTPIGIVYLGRYGLYRFTGQTSHLISDAVTPEINDISQINVADCVGFAWNNEYHLSYTSDKAGGSTHNRVMIYDSIRDAYVIDSKSVNCFTSLDSGSDYGTLYAGSSETDGYIYAHSQAGYALDIKYKSELDEGTFADTSTSGTEDNPRLSMTKIDNMESYITDTLAQAGWVTSVTDLVPTNDLGDGADGAFDPAADCTISGTKNYTTFEIDTGITVTCAGPTKIHCQKTASIVGTLTATGQGYDGGAATSDTGGAGQGPGGGSGGGGSRPGLYGPGGGGGGGYGTAGAAGSGSRGNNGGGGGIAYGDPQLTEFEMGSGGGGCGAYEANASSAKAGGDGGGAIKLMAVTITLTGTISANGTNGSAGEAATSGAGSGGAIWLKANTITATGGTISAVGGTAHGPNGVGGNGRVRLDYSTLTGGTITPTSGYTGIDDFEKSLQVYSDHGIYSEGTYSLRAQCYGGDGTVDGTITKTLSATDMSGYTYILVDVKASRAPDIGIIQAYADGTGKVLVTSENHELEDDDIIVISGTTNYNGSWTVDNATDDTFTIADTWVADDALGTWTKCDMQFGLGEGSLANLIGLPISVEDTWETVKIDVSGITNADIDAVTKIGVKFVDTDADNTVYFDNIRPGLSSGTWASPIYDINAEALLKLYWNEFLNIYGDVTWAARVSNSATFTGVTSAVANNGSAKCRFTTSAAHGLLAGDYVTVAGYTGGNVGYNDTFAITAISDTTHFDVDEAYVGDAAGTWESAWSTTEYTNPNGSDITEAAHRYIQFRATLTTTDTDNYLYPEIFQADGYAFKLVYSKVGTNYETSVFSEYRTGWMDLGAPLYKKLIRKVRVYYTGTEGELTVGFRNSEGHIDRTFVIDMAERPSTSDTDAYVGNDAHKIFTYDTPVNSAASPSPVGEFWQFYINSDTTSEYLVQKIVIQHEPQDLYD